METKLKCKLCNRKRNVNHIRICDFCQYRMVNEMFESYGGYFDERN